MTIDEKTKRMEMVRGDTEILLIRCKKEPFESGDIIEFSVRKTATTERLIHKTTTEFIEGEGYIQIDPADTSGLSFGDYVYDIQITRSSGMVKTPIKASIFTLAKEVTYDG